MIITVIQMHASYYKMPVVIMIGHTHDATSPYSRAL